VLTAACAAPDAPDDAADDCTVARPSGRRPYQLIVHRVSRRAIVAPRLASGAVVFIIDPEQAHEVSAERIARLLHLTGAEARLATALAAGLSLTDYAARAGISLGTARWTLKQALAKTSTDKQAALVALVLKSAVVRGEP
jgi:DNA-binding CsgD family transcriptional regulator